MHFDIASILTFPAFQIDIARCGTQRRTQPTDNMLDAKFFLGELGVGLVRCL